MWHSIHLLLQSEATLRIQSLPCYSNILRACVLLWRKGHAQSQQLRTREIIHVADDSHHRRFSACPLRHPLPLFVLQPRRAHQGHSLGAPNNLESATLRLERKALSSFPTARQDLIRRRSNKRKWRGIRYLQVLSIVTPSTRWPTSYLHPLHSTHKWTPQLSPTHQPTAQSLFETTKQATPDDKRNNARTHPHRRRRIVVVSRRLRNK